MLHSVMLNHLKFPIHASSSLMLVVPIAQHSVDGIFGRIFRHILPNFQGMWLGSLPELETTDPENRIRTRACQSPAQALAMGEHHSWSKVDLQTEKERDWENETQREPVIFPFLRKTVLRLDSKRFLKFLIMNPLQLACQQNDSWLRHKVGVCWQATDLWRNVELAGGWGWVGVSQQGKGKCMSRWNQQSTRRGKKAAGSTTIIEKLPPNTQAMGFPRAKF